MPQLSLAVTPKILPEIKIFDAQGVLKKSFLVFGKNYQGTADLAVVDLGGDGTKEIIVGAGGGNWPAVEVWRGEGSKIYDFLAYDKNFKGGVFVGAGDIDGDKKEEIITGAGYGGGPHVRIFKDKEPILNFFAFNKDDRQGTKVTAADLGGDGRVEILAGSSFNQQPELLLFDNLGGKLSTGQKFNFSSNSGLNLSKLDINGDKKNEILLASGYGNPPEVFILDNRLKEIGKFLAAEANYQGGINVAGGDIDNDGQDEIITSISFAGQPRIKIFKANGELIKEFWAYDTGYRGGVKVAAGDVDGDGRLEIITLPERIFGNLRTEYKYIEVDLKQQRLKYWQGGYQLGSFLISSGLAKTPTPTGEFVIYNKRPKVTMSWYYGPNNPMNYNLPGVPWVSSFSGHYTIHGTYWHNNFGHPMSHGCINMKTPEAKIIYDWADLGTKVIIN